MFTAGLKLRSWLRGRIAPQYGGHILEVGAHLEECGIGGFTENKGVHEKLPVFTVDKAP